MPGGPGPALIHLNVAGERPCTRKHIGPPADAELCSKSRQNLKMTRCAANN